VPQPRPDRPDPEPNGALAGADSSRTSSGLLVEFALFLCSYAPLFAILAVRFRPWWLVGVCGGLALVGIAAGVLVLGRFRRVAAMGWPLVAVDDRGAEVAGYLASYLLPFLTVSEPSLRDLVAYALFLVVLAVIYVRSGLVRVNPTLYLLGWRLQEVEIGDTGWTGYVLSRRALRKGENVSGVRLTERLFLSYSSEEELRDDRRTASRSGSA
jgi:hypothetical protein